LVALTAFRHEQNDLKENAMAYTTEEVAKKIDHAVLKPEHTEADLAEHAAMCRERGVFSMCVRPCDVLRAAQLLDGSGVLVSVVLSFPHGADTPEVKAFQAKTAVAHGALEIDMVMNIGKFLSHDHDYVVRDIMGVVDVAHDHGVKVKVIQESGYLTLDQVDKACGLAAAAGADFVKTSTGFGPGAATPEIVDVMLRSVGNKLGVKASGGIRTWEEACAFLDQGADRLGIGSTEKVLDGVEGVAPPAP